MSVSWNYRTATLLALVAGALAPLSALAGVFNPDVYGTGATMADYMRTVPGGGQPGGPAYTFAMGRYEITNAQFAAFLNDAQLDGGATGRGSNMYFLSTGEVRTSASGPTMYRAYPATGSGITYNATAPIGQRYSPRIVNGLDFGYHPVNVVSWYGALKFSNWLTIDRGLGEVQRAYTEGPNAAEWHPVTISSTDWTTRDMNAGERQALVSNVKGFRLPMEDHSASASAYNEFYKAAAWDSADGVNHTYAFGRETLDERDANGLALNANWPTVRDDPFEEGTLPETTPVGFYDGTNWQQSDWNWPDDDFPTFQTRANENGYGIFDLNGNVTEWAQDQAELVSNIRILRGGGWREGGIAFETSYRNGTGPTANSVDIGFRLVRVPEPAHGAALVVIALLYVRRRRP